MRDLRTWLLSLSDDDKRIISKPFVPDMLLVMSPSCFALLTNFDFLDIKIAEFGMRKSSRIITGFPIRILLKVQCMIRPRLGRCSPFSIAAIIACSDGGSSAARAAVGHLGGTHQRGFKTLAASH